MMNRIIAILWILLAHQVVQGQSNLVDRLLADGIRLRWEVYDFKGAYHAFTNAAAHGSPRAMAELGAMLIDGISPAPLDRPRGYELIRTSAVLGDPTGAYTLGYFLYNGGLGSALPGARPDQPVREPVVAQDIEEALRLYRYAATNGNGMASYRLGFHYLNHWARNGRRAQDANMALGWFEEGHQRGDPNCTHVLADCHLIGLGVATNISRAKALYLESAEQAGVSPDVVNDKFNDVKALQDEAMAAFDPSISPQKNRSAANHGHEGTSDPGRQTD